MHIAIRTDASARIGLGHLARCRTLAQALREQGASVHFICRAHPGHQIDALRADGYRVSALPAPPNNPPPMPTMPPGSASAKHRRQLKPSLP